MIERVEPGHIYYYVTMDNRNKVPMAIVKYESDIRHPTDDRRYNVGNYFLSLEEALKSKFYILGVSLSVKAKNVIDYMEGNCSKPY